MPGPATVRIQLRSDSKVGVPTDLPATIVQ